MCYWVTVMNIHVLMRLRVYVSTGLNLLHSLYLISLKVGLYFRRRQALHTPPRDAPLRSISWHGPAGVNVRQCRGKKYKRTRV